MVHSNFLDPEEGAVALGKSWQDPTDIGACLVECAKRLHDLGYLAATDGNMSLRMSDEEIWITPTDCVKAFAQPDDMAVITLNNETEKGNASSERNLHLAIYRACPTAKAVVFAHPPAAIALSISYPEWNEIPRDIIPSVVLGCGKIPIVTYSTPASPEICKNVREFLPEARLMILSRYGALAWGETLDEAYMGIERLEHACVVIARSLSLGQPTRLSAKEIDALDQARLLVGPRTM